MTRTQLNIKVDPELLKLLKACATRQGVTLTEFVAAVLAKAVSEEDHPSLGGRGKRAVGMQRVRLNQHALELNRVQKLPQRLGFAAGIGGVGGLDQSAARGTR